MWPRLLFPVLAVAALGQDLPSGQIIDSVECVADARQHYALYVPSNYSPARKWSVIFVFDAGGRGRRGVERYQAAAEKYGYILAGSNNSRNGPFEPSLAAAKAMMDDVDHRFSLDPKRVYTAGMSGGARVAMQVSLNLGNRSAGVMASSAGFPEEVRKSVPFPIFATAGTDDFNYLEMRALEQEVKTPHRLVIFNGPHTWLPADVATEAVEWMEVQAMKTGRRPRDPELLDRIFAARLAQIDADTDGVRALDNLISLASDFQGLKDVTKITMRALALQARQDIKDAVDADLASMQREARQSEDIERMRDELARDPASRNVTFAKLSERLRQLARESIAAEDSTGRRMARRILAGLGGSSRGVSDPGLQQLLREVRPPAPADR